LRTASRSPGGQRRSQFLFALNGTMTFCLLHLTRLLQLNRMDVLTPPARLMRGPLIALGAWVWLLAPVLFLLFLLLPLIMRALGIKNGPLEWCLGTAICYWAVSVVAWLGGFLHQALYLIESLGYGGLLGVLAGVYAVPFFRLLPSRESERGAAVEAAVMESNKWWQGLNLLVFVAVAVFVSGSITWVLSPPPVDSMDMRFQVYWHVFICLLAAGPSMAAIVWNVIRRTNAVQDQLTRQRP